MRKPCLTCRKLTENGSRCEWCQPEHMRMQTERRLISEPWRAAYNDPRWPKAQRACFKRDDYQCRAKLEDGTRCPETDDLQAHHMEPLSEIWHRGGDPFSLSILVTVCRHHHAIADAARRAR